MLLFTLTLTTSPQLEDLWTASPLFVVAASATPATPVGTVSLSVFMLITGFRVALVRGSNLELERTFELDMVGEKVRRDPPDILADNHVGLPGFHGKQCSHHFWAGNKNFIKFML